MESCSWQEQFKKGNDLANRGDHLEAIKCFVVTVKYNPEHAMAWNNIGVSKLCLSNPEEAVIAYKKALRIDSEYRDALHNRALAYSDVGELDSAMVDLNRAISLDPEHWASYKHRSILNQMLGNSEQSFKDYIKFKELAYGN
ncbi:MAG: tetratricopeptide repeat protein [SAR202 cluster bacterium]|nr:tetratricopeptide repeat protein [SAR202 cluster bacterium]